MSYRRTKLLFRPFTQPKENNEERYSYLKLRACDCVEAASHDGLQHKREKLQYFCGQ